MRALSRRRALVSALAALSLVVPATARAAAAPDGPGALSHFDLARKDCLGTARNDTSKVWFTVAGGVLSDVYFPTIDTTNVKTLQYAVTDGSTFTDLQSRDMTYTVQALDDRALSCRVTSTAASGKYRIVTDYVTDPARATVLMHTHFDVLKGKASDYRLYVLHDPTINGNGGGGSGNGGADSAATATAGGHSVLTAQDPVTSTNAANRDYAVPVHSALDVSGGLTEATNGFAGQASDPLDELDAGHAITTAYDSAVDGNVVQAGRVTPDKHGDVTLALSYGTTQDAAIATAQASLKRGFDDARAAYEAGWHRYDGGLVAPPKPPGMNGNLWHARLDAYYLNANVLRASGDKTFPGAFVASLASPWGQAVSAGDPANTYFGSYREVFARDLYETFTGLLLDGDRAAARSTVHFLFDRQQLADGSMPRNSLVNGKTAPDSFNTQLDECAFPIVMAFEAGVTDATTYETGIKPAANFVMAHGPSFGPERWEEQSGYSPSTIAAEIAGLVSAAAIADTNGDTRSATLWRATADEFARSVKGWTVTTNGPASPDPYFIRLSKTGDPNAAISYNVGNGGPTLDQRSVIDAGFLELVRLGILAAGDGDVGRSLQVVDKTIERSTVTGIGFFRYNGDGYGDGSNDGHPWAPTDKGNGHLWPVLAGERGEHEVDLGDPAAAFGLLDSMRNMASGVGLIPEQAWELPDLAASPYGTDPEIASIGFRNGQPAGSAAPLTWSAAQYVRLFRDATASAVLERPRPVQQRYGGKVPASTPLTVTAPPDQSLVTDPAVTVMGTSAPGNTIVIAATNIDGDFSTSTAQTTADASGAFSAAVALAGGTDVITITATSPSGATAWTQRTVLRDVPPGTLIYEATDPGGDDSGPGNYAYPTSDNFKPGAYDLERFQVFDAGDSIVFRVRTRDLSPTFGSPIGAQLVDVYVRDPASPGPFSTAASFPQRNYVIGAAGAWDRLIEVQGFGQRFVDGAGNTVGSVDGIGGNPISRYISFRVTKAALGGTPASGWRFTVVLTGQDGFSPDQARGFQPTPQEFQFGVCATASGDPHCTFDPGQVPKAMDVFTPAGTLQSDELDYTLHSPVTIAPIEIP